MLEIKSHESNQHEIPPSLGCHGTAAMPGEYKADAALHAFWQVKDLEQSHMKGAKVLSFPG